jgi:hypothetical protein
LADLLKDFEVVRGPMGIGHYYFHILDDGASVPDDEGMILSRQAATAELRASVYDLTRARMRGGRGPGDGLVQLADVDGRVLETLWFRKVLN